MSVRWQFATRAALVASALLVASCASLTQTLAGLPTEGPKGDAGAVAVPTPAVPAPGSPAARTESVPSSDKPRVFPGTGVFLNTKPAPEFPAGGPEEASLNFEGLDVREVAKVILGDYLRESYSVHPSVTGTVTFRTIRPIPRAALMPTLEMLLRQNNATVVKEEGVFKVLPIVAVRGSVSPQLGGDSRPLPPGFSVVVVPVRYVGAREMAKILEPFAADNTVRVDEVRNLVILAGSQREMRHLLDTVALFDVDWLSGYSVGIFPVRSADVKSLVADLDKVFGPTAQGPLAGLVRVIPIERLNALLIVTTQPKYLESAKSWIERLDQIGGTAGGARLFVYAVRNGKAENLAQLLNDIFTRRTGGAIPAVSLAPGARPAQISTPAQAGGMGTPAAPAAQPAAASPGASFVVAGGTGTVQSDVRIIADKDNNALLILATPVDYEIIEAALVKLDVIPRQVLVEVTVAEVQLTDDLQFGVDWFLTPRVRSDGSITSGALNMGGLPATPTGAVPAFTGLQLINRLGGDVRGVLNALGQDGRLQVLATPQLMVLDNQKAQIKIGDRISVQTQQQTVAGTTTGLINSFQYIETGILLTVTPRINPGGQVTVEVNQEVSIPKDPFIQGNTNPDIGQRTATTTVVVASGETIVLGGLIREDNQRSTAGIPLLSKIPVLGAAFGTQQIIKRRTETILLIKPVVLTNTAQAVAATEELRRKMPSLEGFLPLRQTPPLAR